MYVNTWENQQSSCASLEDSVRSDQSWLSTRRKLQFLWKSVFGVSIKASNKPVSSATETSKKIESSPVARLNMVLSKKRITKALIRLGECAGWSAPVLFANPQRQVFSC